MSESMNQTASDPPKPEPHFTFEGRQPQKPSNLLLILMVLVLVGLVGYGGYYAGKYFSAPTTQYIAPTPLAIPVVPTPAASVDSTADWKTYQNKEMGFSIKYPSYYIPREVTDLGPNDQRVIFLAESGDVGLSSFSVHVSKAELPEFPYDEKPTGEYTLDGTKGNYIELPKGYGDGPGFTQPFIATYVAKLGRLHQIKFDGVSSINDKTVDQILSTFKFVDENTGFSKRLFNPTDKLIENYGLPTILTNLKDSELIGINCSHYYEGDYNGGFVTYFGSSSSEGIKLTDEELLSFVRNNPSISAISQCKTDSGETIIHYEVFAGGGGMGNVAYFGKLSASGTIQNKITIPNDGAPYFGCRNPYALTKNNIFYWGCGGGDGGFGQVSIYAINFSKATVDKVTKCTSTANSSADDPVGTSTVVCN